MQMAHSKISTFPEVQDFNNKQLLLFQHLLCNTEEERQELSNSIEFWDCIPRYSMSRLGMNKMRDKNGFLGLLKLDFEFRDSKFNLQIQPALVEDKKTGKTTAYYPSANEELVEEALRKLAVDQKTGFYDKTNFRSGVVFSLYQLREELKRIGKTRSYDEIKLSLDILSGSSIQIIATSEKNKTFAKSNYLPMLKGVTREELNSDYTARWLVQFHPFVTDSIDKLNYRQYNYQQFMTHSTQLARWLHKLLICKYVFANRFNSFEIHFKTIKRDSSMLNNYARPRKAVAVCDFSLNELRENGVLINIDRRIVAGLRGKISDIVYTLTPSDGFVAEVKAANKRRQSQNLSTATK